MLNNILQILRTEAWQVALELLVIWVCVYLVFRFLRGTRGAGVVKGAAVLLVVATLTIRVLGQSSEAFARLDFLYDNFLSLVAIVLIVVFQPELRQAMVRIGHAWSFGGGSKEVQSLVAEIDDAVQFLSKSQFGALIAIERESKLGGLVETGVYLDAQVGAKLLQSIFWPNSPLHDLGVVIRGDRIVAATVQFPLIEEGHLGPEYGSRHRAGAGLTVETDCLVVIVSEETGGISIAERGVIEKIERDRFQDELARRLSRSPVEQDDDETSGDEPGAGAAATGDGEPARTDAEDQSTPPAAAARAM